MSLWRQLSRGTRALTHSQATEREVADEVQQYLDDATADNIARGMTPDDARRAARVHLGSSAAVRDEVRASGWEHIVSTTLSDTRFALRQLAKNPSFAAIVIFILALGIGATTAIFSAINPILFAPLPYPGASRLVMVWEGTAPRPHPLFPTAADLAGQGGAGRMPNFATYHGIAERTRSFESMAAFKAWQPTMTGPTQPERFDGQRVGAPYFSTLGIKPALGRDFTAADDLFHGPKVVLLSYQLWQRRFRGDPSVLGQAITLDGDPFTVIGVMPAGFENVLAPEAQLWAPLQYDPALLLGSREWGHHLRVVGRLRPGITRAQAMDDLDAILPALARDYARGYDTAGGPPKGAVIDSLQTDISQDVRPALLAVFGAVLLVLLIACVNVTNLLLARSAQRRGEFAMRVALGAARGRLVRQLITESLLVSAIGGALAILVADYGVHALVALAPPELPRLSAIRMDPAVFAFGFLVTILIGLAVGIVPALHAFRGDLQAAVQQNSRGTVGGHQSTRRGLVVAEVALALVLLVSAGLLLRSMQRLFSTDPGFDAAHVLTMQVQESGHRYDGNPARIDFFRRAQEAVRAVPGVESAAFTSQLPLSGDLDVYGFTFEKDANKMFAALKYAVTPGYFAAMRIPLRRGRYFDERDTNEAPRVAIINESFARRAYGNEDPIGKRVCLRCDLGSADRPWSVIVGVVSDVKQSSLAVDEEDAFYVPNTQWYWADSTMSLVVRARGNAADLAPSVKAAVWSIDKDQPIIRVATMQQLLNLSEAKRRFALTVFEAFALVGLLLAATGIYGVLSGGVNERLREIGVRVALGASRSDILTLVVRQGLSLTAFGVGIGLLGAAVASRALITLLFGISRLDPATYFGVVALLAVVAAVACWAPAWRAARVDPSITLRAE